jgi:hypothetical protein
VAAQKQRKWEQRESRKVTNPDSSLHRDQQSEIEHAIQNDLTPEQRSILEQARELYRGKAKGRDFDGWLVLGNAHDIRIRLALLLSDANGVRRGSRYTGYLHRLMENDGIDTKDKKMMSNLTALAWIHDQDHPERLTILTEARAQMTEGELANLNSPITAKKLIKSIINQRSGYEPGPRVSPMAKVMQQRDDAIKEVELLKQRLESRKDSTALDVFDWGKDSVKKIAKAMVYDEVGRTRKLQDAINAELKEYDERQRNRKPPEVKR